jgi:hypothetical protein
MTRAVVQGLVLFFLPFVLFAAYLVIRRRSPMLWSHWSSQSLWLTIAGLGFVVLSLIATAMLDERRTGTYVPTRVENGRVIPGHFE